MGARASAPRSPLPAGEAAVTVITGGGSGIGKDLALLLAAAGGTVVIVGRRANVLDKVASEAPDKIFACPADVGTPEGRASVAAFVGKRPVSILVNCAAVWYSCVMSEMSLESYQSGMRVNVEAPIFLTQALMPNLKANQDRARVLMIGSGAADVSLPTMGHYCMTKAAMKMSWKVLRDELKDVVDVGHCVPGLVRTELTDQMVKDPSFALKDFIAGRYESGDIHPSKEVAEWMAALLDKSICSDEIFPQQEHDIDNASHHFGVKVTKTMEAKSLEN